MHPQRRLVWFRRLALAGALLAAAVIVLGAWVRLTDAGLGCPDWPGCYGHVYPNAGHVDAESGRQFGKALHEMIHRYFAGTLVVTIAILLAWAVRFRKDGEQPLVPVALLFVIVCLQGALGALTVTLLLKPLIVTAHLLGGLTTLGILWWLSLTPAQQPLTERQLALRKFAFVGLAALVVQIALGGWTSSNYAAVACPDFPTCQHSWWPRMDFRDAFVLWRGLGIDYEGGVLANPARVAIHFTHRLGALAAGSILLGLGVAVALSAQDGAGQRPAGQGQRPAGQGQHRAGAGRLTWAGCLLVVAVALQISIGAATVHWGIPLPLAVLHNAGAALLVIAFVTLLRSLWPSPAGPDTAIGVVPLDRVDRTR